MDKGNKKAEQSCSIYCRNSWVPRTYEAQHTSSQSPNRECSSVKFRHQVRALIEKLSLELSVVKQAQVHCAEPEKGSCVKPTTQRSDRRHGIPIAGHIFRWPRKRARRYGKRNELLCLQRYVSSKTFAD